MISKMMLVLAALFGAALFMSAAIPAPDSGCVATWHDFGGTITVGCAQGDCGFNNPCNEVITTAPGTGDQSFTCSCNNETATPNCRGTFTWDGPITRNSDNQPIDPDDWTCQTVDCKNTCNEEAAPNPHITIGLDTPCECEVNP